MSPAREWPLGQGSVDEEPWPGPGAGGAASGVATLTHPGTGDVARGGWIPIAAWRGPEPKPCAVMLATSREANTQLRAFKTEVTGAFGLGGIVRVSYGLGAALRVLEVDLRSGCFQLPPTDFVNLEAMLWNRSAAALAVSVSGAIVPGLFTTPARFTSSLDLTILQNESYTDTPPAGARYVAMTGGNPTALGGSDPILTFKQGTAGLYMRHDYAAGVFLGQPGQASELLSTANFVVANEGTSSRAVTLRFYLEA